jgi:hypothetical protein
MLEMGVSFGEVAWITFDNHNGQAMSAISFPHSMGRSTLDHLTFFSTPNKPWGTAAIVCPSSNYTTWRRVEGLAGPFLNFTGAMNGTDLNIESSVFEDVTKSATPWFLVNGSLERLIFRHVTWNIHRPDSIVLRTAATSQPWHVSIVDCEYDDNSKGHPPNATWLDLNNVKVAEVVRSTIYGGGQRAALIRLTKSRLTLRNNTMQSVPYLATATDSDSCVFAEQNFPNGSSVAGLADSTVRSAQVVPVTVKASSARLHGERINPSAHVLFRIEAADTKSFVVTWAKGADSDWGFMTAGQLFTVMMRNTAASAGAAGTNTFKVTFPPTHFKTSGPFVSPAPGKNRSITFVNDGSHAVEVWRSAADVDN